MPLFDHSSHMVEWLELLGYDRRSRVRVSTGKLSLPTQKYIGTFLKSGMHEGGERRKDGLRLSYTVLKNSGPLKSR